MKNLTKLSTLALCIAALGLVYCGEEDTDDTTPTTDAGTVLPKPDGGQTTTDGGQQTETDGGTPAGLTELNNVTLKDIRANPSKYYEGGKTKAIVNVVGAVVVSDYAHSSGGNHSIYVEQGTGADKAGMLVYASLNAGETAPAIGSKVDVRGCANAFRGVVQIQYCQDDANTQASFSNVASGTVPALGASDKVAVSELGLTSTSQDAHLGLRVEATGTLTKAATQPADCTNGTDVYCIAMNDGVVIKPRFTYKCEGGFDGPFTNLVGVWDGIEQTTTKGRSIVPLSCADLDAARATK